MPKAKPPKKDYYDVDEAALGRVKPMPDPKKRAQRLVDNPLERAKSSEARKRAEIREANKQSILSQESRKPVFRRRIKDAIIKNISALVPMKPVSTNRLYTGKRFKSPQAKQFEVAFRNYLLLKLPPSRLRLPEGDLTIHWRFGTSRKMDVTNCLKLAEDVLAKHCGFNDNIVVGTSAVRVHVKTGGEFIAFQILPFRDKDYPQMIIREEPEDDPEEN